MSIPKQASIWDDRRNTSRAHITPNAYPDAMRALIRLRATNAALVRWIEDGYPNMSEAEHVARFGEKYKAMTWCGARVKVVA